MKEQTLLAVGLVAILLPLGYFAFVRDAEQSPFVDPDDRVARLEEQQRRQFDLLNAKMDRLAGAMRPVAESAGPPLAGTARFVDPHNERMTPQQQEMRQARIKQDLDTQLESQSVDSKWSLESTRTIEKALTADNLKEIGAAPPVASDIQCRSSMCRIQLVYGDRGSASDAGMMLNMAMAERMPYTQVVSQQRTDGGVDYFIYATPTPASSASH